MHKPCQFDWLQLFLLYSDAYKKSGVFAAGLQAINR